ncbi:MAG TPA: hypothetical protein VH478_18780 [Trebonia sp.]|jgi:hypothetical protein|nr:hypothetical protein [Trebonia sp.]
MSDRVLHQIEYRFVEGKGFSLGASSHPWPKIQAKWDARIRPWVSHPGDGRPWLSVRYQRLPDEAAAVAWRRCDGDAARRQGDGRQEHLFSRVLFGPESVLTFDAALVACTTRLDGKALDSSYYDPKAVTLPHFQAADLTALVPARAKDLDQKAAAQEGLQQVVTVALAAPDEPLVIEMPNPFIQAPPENGVQYPLLWGLRRIAGPLLGPGGRDWSFSTYELPLGQGDPPRVPSIVFRQALPAQLAPSGSRQEARADPFNPRVPSSRTPDGRMFNLAGLLVTEYERLGGDELQQFLCECSGDESTFEARISKVEAALRARPVQRSLSVPAAAADAQPASASAAEPPPAPAPPQQATASRDAYTAGRDQYNHITYGYPDQSSETTSLGVLSASEGAKLLTGLSRTDETLNRARNVLTGVTPDVAAPALRMLLRRDEDRAIALLATINESRAAALVEALGPDGAGAGNLLAAAEAVTQCEGAEHKALGERDGWFQRATSPRGTRGFVQKYANGAIHWSPEHGALATSGEIAQCHGRHGSSGGVLGFPVAPAVQGRHPGTETDCTRQLFEGPADYGPQACVYLDMQCGATVVSTPEHGAHAMWGAIGERCELDWRDRAETGVPVDGAVTVGPSPRVNEPATSGWRQRFESGAIYASEKAGAIMVPPSWASYLEARGGVLGSTGFPVGPARRAASSPYGTAGWYQRFEGTADYPRDAVQRWAWQDRVPSAGATIYHSGQHGPHVVEGAIGARYEELNGTYGWLGFPISDEADISAGEGALSGTGQHFEGGLVFCTPEHGPVPVGREVADYLGDWPSSQDQIGLPVQSPEPLASGYGSYVQSFERGIVVVRDGTVRAYVDRAD